MKFAFTLTPAESKRLIAKAIMEMEEFKRAYTGAYVIVLGGTTNAFLMKELGWRRLLPQHCTAGISTRGVLCVTNPEKREKIAPLILHQGKRVERDIQEAINDFHKDTVIVKGANAIDPEGNVGIITSGFDGGDVARFIGTATSQGLTIICAVGLEKMVASVKEASRAAGARTIDYSMGADFGMYCLTNVARVTELEALKLLTGVDTVHVASGGVGGSEGAVSLIAEGEELLIKETIEIVKSVKGEPAVSPLKGECDGNCRYFRCAYYNQTEEELPGWLKE